MIHPEVHRRKKALVIAVGLGEGVESGLAKAIQTHNPDSLLFLATEKSQEETLAKVSELLGGLGEHDITLISDENDIEECYSGAREAIETLLQKGYSVEADFTSGTKAMSAGLVMAATACEAEALSYVSGKRDKNGRVISGTERFIRLIPNRILAAGRRDAIIRFFKAYQFEACIELASQMLDRTEEPEIRADFETLRALAEAYWAWDRFDHQGASNILHSLEEDSLKRFGVKGAVIRGKSFLRRFLQKSKETPYPEEVLADLLCNAARRAEEGKWDDATARLYRATEFLAQYQLWTQYGLDIGDLKVEKLPLPLQDEYESKQDRDGKVKLSLREGYTLLEALGDPLGGYSERLRGPLEARNMSILAHGLEPVGERTYQALAEEVERVIEEVAPEALRLRQEGLFPRLRV